MRDNNLFDWIVDVLKEAGYEPWAAFPHIPNCLRNPKTGDIVRYMEIHDFINQQEYWLSYDSAIRKLFVKHKSKLNF